LRTTNPAYVCAKGASRIRAIRVQLAEEPEWGIRRNAVGVHSFGRVEYEIREGEVLYKDRGRYGSW
jgi:hypothetical protein